MKIAKTPPRRKSFSLTLLDFGKMYNSELPKEDRIPPSKYRDILGDFFNEIMRKIMYDRHVFKIPLNMGFISLTSRVPRVKNAPPDFHKIKKGNKTAKFLNLHTFSRLWSVTWLKGKNIRLRNSKYYKFTFANSPKLKSMGLGGYGIRNMIEEAQKMDNTKILHK